MRNSEEGGGGVGAGAGEAKEEGEGGQDAARMDLLQKLLTLKRLVDTGGMQGVDGEAAGAAAGALLGGAGGSGGGGGGGGGGEYSDSDSLTCLVGPCEWKTICLDHEASTTLNSCFCLLSEGTESPSLF